MIGGNYGSSTFPPPSLQTRGNWTKDRKNVSIGDIVLLIDSSIKISEWQMVLVTHVYKGDDGRVRSARVKTSSGLYDRPITRRTSHEN